ncbi:RHS repeat domain-containing protein [Acidovorax sp. NCPPB 4044]|nr:RHS repeat domain-containing protein [Acidovorax sp. NCPPB 4044]MDA8519508.1 RHS repeat protein [Acidovorax sp. NCPPB 4044]
MGYDAANRMAQEARPDGSRRSFAHDPLGRVVAMRIKGHIHP